jgi:hypothetical protein
MMKLKRVAVGAAAIVGVGAVTLVCLTLPPKAAMLPAPAWTFTAIPGAYHIHTVHSDGSGTIEDVAAAAAHDGLRFVIITDHGTGAGILPPAYHAGVLCIDAVEISTAGGHYVALGLTPPPYPLGGEPRDVVADVARLGGFGIVAHPYSTKPALRWTAWDLPFNGVEWMNADSERRHRTPWELAVALTHYPFRPAETLVSLFTRPVENLTRWDTLTMAGRRIVGLAGADAHARVGLSTADPQTGVTLARLPTYQASFGAFSIHAEVAGPMTGDARQDARTVLDAIEAGHVYTSIDGLARPAAFTFTARSGGHEAAEGDDLILDGPVTLRARVNDSHATIVLFRDGVPMQQADGGAGAFHVAAAPAVFRVEVHRQGSGARSLPWIVSNPIYVLTRPRETPPVPPLAAVTASETLPAGAQDGWRTEQARGSTITIAPDSESAPGPPGVQIRFRLGEGARDGQYVAAVHSAPSDIASFSRLAFQTRANRPLRMSVQVRDAAGRRWLRSVYVDSDVRTVVAPFADLRPIDGAWPPHPDLSAVQDLMFVVDLTNALPGSAGRIGVEDLRLER